MANRSFRIEEDLFNRMEEFIASMGQKYKRSEVLSTAIFMYYKMFGDNPAVPDNQVIEDSIERDKDKSKAAMWVYKWAKKGKVQKGINICTDGVKIRMPKGTLVFYKPPNIIEFELFKGCYNQLIMDEEEFTIDENDNIYL